MKLDKYQLETIENINEQSIVFSGAGAGKTRCLIEKLSKILKNNINKNIVVITFTNNAADEIKQRIGDVNSNNSLFIGTIHSYANQLLINKNINTSKIIKDKQFDRLFNLIRQRPDCIDNVDYLLLDEAQDSTDSQFNFILSYIKPKYFTFYGDVNQSIYGFNGAEPELLLNISQKSNINTYYLKYNYRNANDILEFAQDLIARSGNYDKTEPFEYKDGEVIPMKFTQTNIINIFKTNKNYKNWFILTRTNKQLIDILHLLQDYSIPVTTFKQKDLNNEEIQQKLSENKIKLLTIHSAKGLEADNVIVIGNKMYNKEEIRIAYVAATRAKKRLYWCH